MKENPPKSTALSGSEGLSGQNKRKRKFPEWFLSLIFPDRCPYCQQVISGTDTECAICRAEIPSEPIIQYLPTKECCVSPFAYASKVRNAVIGYKFKGKKYYSRSFSKYTAKAIRQVYKDHMPDVITAVPLSKKRLRQRGYNQAEIVAAEVAAILNIPYQPLLVKTKSNPEQHHLTLTERKNNVKNVYSVIGNADLSHQTILIIDDIVTTGYTLSECCRTLKQNGASVICACIASALKI